MNIKQKHDAEKPVSAKPLFQGTAGTTIALQLLRGGILKEHTTNTPALLLCIEGKATYSDENGQTIELSTGDYCAIPPDVIHRLEASEDTQLILLK